MNVRSALEHFRTFCDNWRMGNETLRAGDRRQALKPRDVHGNSDLTYDNHHGLASKSCRCCYCCKALCRTDSSNLYTLCFIYNIYACNNSCWKLRHCSMHLILFFFSSILYYCRRKSEEMAGRQSRDCTTANLSQHRHLTPIRESSIPSSVRPVSFIKHP